MTDHNCEYRQDLANALEWHVLLSGALKELCGLKKLKDVEGKTVDYKQRQLAAWAKAFEIIAMLKKDDGFVKSPVLNTSDLIILSYHRFVETESDYRFSRTYEQFAQDITKKVYDLITIDDGMLCQIRACELLRGANVRAKLFICTGLVGTKGYCTWDQLRELSKFHDIENHSSVHKDHALASYDLQKRSILIAQNTITTMIGKAPRYFVAPYNQYNTATDMIATEMGLITLKNRVNILNISK